MRAKHDILWISKADSSNSEVKRRISELDNLSVLSVMEQTAGRGQQGNTWISNPGENLTFSILLKDEEGRFTADEGYAISQIAALSIVDLLAMYGIVSKIKWPNDIYVNDRKICGILIENTLRGRCLAQSITGIGLNVNQTDFPSSLPAPVSMLMCIRETSSSEDALNLHELLKEYMEIFEAYLERYLDRRGTLAQLKRLYISQLWRFGEKAEFIDMRHGRKVRFSGVICDVTQNANLVIKTDEGELDEFAFKEISYVI